jgi:hypothetical protein
MFQPTWHCCMCCNPANGRMDFEDGWLIKSSFFGCSGFLDYWIFFDLLDDISVPVNDGFVKQTRSCDSIFGQNIFLPGQVSQQIRQ